MLFSSCKGEIGCTTGDIKHSTFMHFSSGFIVSIFLCARHGSMHWGHIGEKGKDIAHMLPISQYREEDIIEC